MLLETINSPEDLKRFSISELQELASEIRSRIIEVVSQTGGHLASSLGVVELTIALHYCLSLPEDAIIWDVGHQVYAHKLLTGRNKRFSSLRQHEGISGFSNPRESIFDIFTSGHSGDAVSLAMGMALKKPRDKKTVAVIGDGSLSNGLCFEGLNNAGQRKDLDLIVILNTNELSISPSTGALSNYLNKIISLPIYNRFRSSLEAFIKRRIPRGSRLLKLADKFEEGLKGLFVPGVFFEELGFRYFGPLDGHNLELLLTALKNIRRLTGPRLLHIITRKGKGYLPAEKDPVRFHSAAPFDIKTGAPKTKTGTSYTDVFGQKLTELAKRDSRIVAITAAMTGGTGLARFKNLYPDRFFDVDIAESCAVCFASGLAKQGFKPVVAVYSTFLQRAYDQLIENVALQDVAVVFCLDRAGLVAGDGPTHQGVFDLAYLRHIPHFVLMAPCCADELKEMLEFALGLDKPAVIRYPKSVCPPPRLRRGVSSEGGISPLGSFSPLKLGKGEILKEGKDITIIALGSMVLPSLEAAGLLEKQGISCSVINARFLKPLDTDLFNNIKTKAIFTVEEGILCGGFGSAVGEVLNKRVFRLGLPDEFIPHGSRDILLKKYGLTGDGIAQTIREHYGDGSR